MQRDPKSKEQKNESQADGELVVSGQSRVHI